MALGVGACSLVKGEIRCHHERLAFVGRADDLEQQFRSQLAGRYVTQFIEHEQVLIAAIQEGAASLMWQSDTFAYAEGWDEPRQRYQRLRAAQAIRVVVVQWLLQDHCVSESFRDTEEQGTMTWRSERAANWDQLSSNPY